jgi:APA family basic amino acid/polyamine antiporter
MALSILVCLNGSTMSGARVPYAAALDGLFFRRFAQVHPHFRSPSTSLVAQGLVSTVLLLFLSQFQQLFNLTVFAEWLFYALAASTVFVYRRKLPNAPRPYRVWGYPVLPAIFVGSAVVVLVSSYAGNLRGSLIGTALILSGLPAMWLIRKQRAMR